MTNRYLLVLLIYKQYVVCIGYGMIIIPTVIYLYYKIGKNWDFLTGTFILFVNILLITLSVNLGLYAIWLLFNVFYGVAFLGIVLLEGILLISTCFWRMKQIKQGKFRAYKQSAVAETLPSLVAICGVGFLRFTFVNYTVTTQTLIASILFVVLIYMTAVFLGWTAIPMYYLCSKFGIPEECKNQRGEEPMQSKEQQ